MNRSPSAGKKGVLGGFVLPCRQTQMAGASPAMAAVRDVRLRQVGISPKRFSASCGDSFSLYPS